MKFFITLIFIIFNSFSSYACSKTKSLKIITSIRPIYSIFKNIATEEIYLDFLIKQQSSTHDFYLKPSDRSKLKNADFIFIIDRNFETEIWSTIKKLGLENKTIELTSIKNLDLLDNRELFSDHSHDHHDDHSHNHDHEEESHHHHGPKDYHIWLDPSIALQIAEVFREAIKDKIANNNVITNKIMENYNQFLSNIDELKNFSNNKINNLENSANFMVYHDGYQYFEKFANLEKLDKGAIIYGHHLPGIGQTRKLNNYIKENKISCILVEPGYSKKFINKLHENNNFKTAEIDGEWGPNDVLDKNIYFDMMRSLVNNMTNCITQIQKD